MKSIIALLLLPSIALSANTPGATKKIPKSFQGNLIMYSYLDSGMSFFATMAHKVPLPANMKAMPQYKNNTNFQLLQIASYPGADSPSYYPDRFNYTQTGFVDAKGNYLQLAPTGNYIGVGKLFTTPKEKSLRTSWKFNDDGTITNMYKSGCIGSSINDPSYPVDNFMVFVGGNVTLLKSKDRCIKFIFLDTKTRKIAGNYNTNGQPATGDA